jgi:hypothetical protein
VSSPQAAEKSADTVYVEELQDLLFDEVSMLANGVWDHVGCLVLVSFIASPFFFVVFFVIFCFCFFLFPVGSVCVCICVCCVFFYVLDALLVLSSVFRWYSVS